MNTNQTTLSLLEKSSIELKQNSFVLFFSHQFFTYFPHIKIKIIGLEVFFSSGYVSDFVKSKTLNCQVTPSQQLKQGFGPVLKFPFT